MQDSSLYALVLGSLIAALRERKGMRQGVLADRLGLSHSMMSRIEVGTAQVESFTLRRIAEELEVDLAEVLRLVDEAMKFTEQAARLTLRTTGKAWWATATGRLGTVGCSGLIAFVVAAVLPAS